MFSNFCHILRPHRFLYAETASRQSTCLHRPPPVSVLAESDAKIRISLLKSVPVEPFCPAAQGCAGGLPDWLICRLTGRLIVFFFSHVGHRSRSRSCSDRNAYSRPGPSHPHYSLNPVRPAPSESSNRNLLRYHCGIDKANNVLPAHLQTC